MQERWQALALSRRHKAVALCVALWILWINVNWAARAQAMLLGALTVRCNLKPAEVRCRPPGLIGLISHLVQWLDQKEGDMHKERQEIMKPLSWKDCTDERNLPLLLVKPPKTYLLCLSELCEALFPQRVFPAIKFLDSLSTP